MMIDRRYRRYGAGAAIAAFLISLALLGPMSGTAQAVASRTSDGLPLPTPGPQASAAQSSAPAAATTPAAPTRSPATSDDLLIVALGLVAAAGFGGGLSLLLRGPSSPGVYAPRPASTNATR